MTMRSLTRKVRKILWRMLFPAHLMTMFLFQLFLWLFKIDYTLFSKAMSMTALSKIIQQLTSNPSVVPYYSWDGSSLRYKGRLVLPQSIDLQHDLFDELHASPSVGHFGFIKTYELVRRNVFWKGLQREIQHMVVKCAPCQHHKGETTLLSRLLEPFPTPKCKT